jgi:N-glycosylase/DNA lyase
MKRKTKNIFLILGSTAVAGIIGVILFMGMIPLSLILRQLALSPEDLAPLRCGYRAPYIINAARTVAGKAEFFEELAGLDTKAARKKIMELEGVGPKVADCFLLFGMHKLDAFPVDTWMKKAAVYYGGKFDPTLFGEYAGIAQQYIFYYARSGSGTQQV